MSLELMEVSGKQLDISESSTNFGDLGNTLKIGNRVGYGTSQITYVISDMSSLVLKVLDDRSQELFRNYDIVKMKQILDELVASGIPLPKIYGAIRGKIDNKDTVIFLQSFLDIYLEDGFPTNGVVGLSSIQDADKIIKGLFQLKNGTIVFSDWIPYLYSRLKNT